MKKVLVCLLATYFASAERAYSLQSKLVGTWTGGANLTIVNPSSGESDLEISCNQFVLKISSPAGTAGGLNVKSSCQDQDNSTESLGRYFEQEGDLAICADGSLCARFGGGESGNYGHISISLETTGIYFEKVRRNEDGDGHSIQAIGLSKDH